ncbi:MAG TPA: hypothetical protein VNL18_15165 [Gemmatimonadales bacterium]|nr:hypothetical protein [Gemmatimonadales bacterium]
MRASLSLLLVCLVARPGAAQDARPLRYAPRTGTVVHTLFNSRVSLVYRDVTGGVTATDSVVGEYTALGAVGQRVIDGSTTPRALDVRLDSLRTRARLVGQAWKETALSDSLRPTMRVMVDERLRLGPMPPAGSSQVGLVRSFGWMGIEFPEEAVAPAGRWTTRAVARLPRELAALHEVEMPDSLDVIQSVVLDSISARGTDTLLYFSFQGSIGPSMVPGRDAGDTASVSLAGAQAGSLIWSTAWQSFVSGASQTRVRARLRVVSGRGGREAELLWTVTTRIQVRI